MLGSIPATHVGNQLDCRVEVVTEHCEVGDADASAPARVEQSVQRPAGGEPRAPVDEADEAVAPDRRAKVGRIRFHDLWVAVSGIDLTPAYVAGSRWRRALSRSTIVPTGNAVQ